MAFLTDRTLATGVSTTDLIHIVITGDTSQNPAGSSYKATMGQVLDLINPTTITGGTYDPVTGTLTFYDDTGGDFSVSGFITGYTNTAVTGLTYNNSNTFTVLENDGTSHSASINVVTGMTFNGFLKTSGSTTSGTYAFAFGDNNTSSGNYSFSQGNSTSATTNYAHSEGRGSLASGTGSHSEGKNTIASGSDSHSEGEFTMSLGDSSHAEGGFTNSIGQASHTEGLSATTYGSYSHAEGLGTITNGDYQHVQGQYNSTASTQSAFIIGNGTSNTNRSNLVLAAGNSFNIYGNLSVTGTTSSGTISATTYQNLPTDIRVTGGTYSAGTATFTNNTGGTFSVTGFTTTFTGNTSGTCISNLYVTNVIGCSPLRIQPTSTDPVYISQSGGNVAIGTPTIDGTAPEALVVSGSSTTSYNLIVGRANVDNYAQLNIVNKSTGATSSADVVATNNTGTELVNFIDMGINGSNYSAGLIGVANDAYLYSTGRELYIGNATTGATANIKFFAGNAALDVDMTIIGATGFVGVGTTSPTTRLDVNGKTRTTTFQITNGAVNSYVLLSDTLGNATWTPQSGITGNTNTFVTGFTYNNANTITLSQNNGQSSGVTINSVTGLTVNGNLNVTGNTTLSATTASTLNISSTPLVDSGLTTYYLTRDSSNGDVKTKIIPGAIVYGLFAQTGNSVAVSATTVETTIIDGGIGTLSVPANGFSVGDSFRADFGGLLSAKNNDTIRIKVKAGSVILADSGTQTMTTAINDVFQFSINFTIRKIGAAGVAEIVALGVFHTTKQSNGSQTGFAFNTVNSTTFDTTISNTLNVTAQWSSNSALNSIYTDIFILNKIF
jgi:hypothetical protein